MISRVFRNHPILATFGATYLATGAVISFSIPKKNPDLSPIANIFYRLAMTFIALPFFLIGLLGDWVDENMSQPVQTEDKA